MAFPPFLSKHLYPCDSFAIVLFVGTEYTTRRWGWLLGRRGYGTMHHYPWYSLSQGKNYLFCVTWHAKFRNLYSPIITSNWFLTVQYWSWLFHRCSAIFDENKTSNLTNDHVFHFQRDLTIFIDFLESLYKLMLNSNDTICFFMSTISHYDVSLNRCAHNDCSVITEKKW